MAGPELFRPPSTLYTPLRFLPKFIEDLTEDAIPASLSVLGRLRVLPEVLYIMQDFRIRDVGPQKTLAIVITQGAVLALLGDTMYKQKEEWRE